MKNDCLNMWKGLGAFFVVFIHCSFPSPAGGMMNGLARFAVPLFFMVSGYFSYGRGRETVRRRLKKTFWLFLFANAVYFLWKLVMLASDKELTAGAVSRLFSLTALKKLLLWNQSPFIYHLWFVGALLYCYLFYGLLVRWKAEERVYFLIPLGIGANLILGEGLTALGHHIPVACVRSFWLTGLPFFLWGHWFAGKERRDGLQVSGKVCVGAIFLGALMSMAEMLISGGAELYAGSVLMSFGMFALALGYPEFGKGGFLARVGEQDSGNIYLWQIIVYNSTTLLAYYAGIRGHKLYQWLMPLWVCLVSLMLAELLGLVDRKIRERRKEKQR